MDTDERYEPNWGLIECQFRVLVVLVFCARGHFCLFALKCLSLRSRLSKLGVFTHYMIGLEDNLLISHFIHSKCDKPLQLNFGSSSIDAGGVAICASKSRNDLQQSNHETCVGSWEGVITEVLHLGSGIDSMACATGPKGYCRLCGCWGGVIAEALHPGPG
jgi:hypothetical protein